MPSVGDFIRFNLALAKPLDPNAQSWIQTGGSVTTGGKIIKDLGDRWLVRMDITIGRSNKATVNKDEPRALRPLNP